MVGRHFHFTLRLPLRAGQMAMHPQTVDAGVVLTAMVGAEAKLHVAHHSVAGLQAER